MRRIAQAEARAFVLAHTVCATPPLLPELRLQLATEVTPLWQMTEATLEASGLPPPYWAFAWAGGQALARHLLDHPTWVRDKCVLDFAAGSGVAGIAAARAGAARVEASELDPLALAALALNAEANGVTLATLAEDVTACGECRWDIVLAGDICYERPMAERATAWLRRCARTGATVLLGDPGRAYLPRDGLIALAAYVVPTSRELEDRETRETRVYQLAHG